MLVTPFNLAPEAKYLENMLNKHFSYLFHGSTSKGEQFNTRQF